MNTLSPVRAAFPTLPAVAVPRPELTPAGRALRPEGLAGVESSPAAEAQPGGGSFSSLLGRMVAEVSAKQSVAGQAVAGLQSGQPVAIHQAMIAMEEASVSFQLMAEVRNRLLESYQELMRMQV
jgi:flagellar hook-basal body complex protein FliE